MVPLRRVYYEKTTYHIISRGNNRRRILESDDDKKRFLGTVTKQKERYRFKLYGFVLMNNHIHMVIEARAIPSISKIMQSILLSYSRTYRGRYNYVGHLWQGRFISKSIEGDQYILDCLEYIHNNPVRALLTKTAQDYFWSSARFYHGLENKVIEEYIEIDRFGHF